MKKLFDLAPDLNMIDIGSSGMMDARWRPLSEKINLIGFDPNEAECERMNALPTDLSSALYLPYAIGGESGESTLYKTESIYCYSLLKPNYSWLNRFGYAHLFAAKGEETIGVRTLDSLSEIREREIDAIKTDTQGLELPILSQAEQQVKQACAIETETGFMENYHGETTYAQIDEFMRDHHFLMFTMKSYPTVRKTNRELPRGNVAQPLWCEAVWLKDYPKLLSAGETFSEEKILKAMLLSSLFRAYDFGYEVAEVAHKKGILSDQIYQAAQNPNFWVITGTEPEEVPEPKKNLAVNLLLRLLPASARKHLSEQAQIAFTEKHLLKG
ncbi:MAG: FkbM family methyltransferase [Bacteroidota bacterium]